LESKDSLLNFNAASDKGQNPLSHLNKWVEDGIRAMRVVGLSGAARAYGFARFLDDLNQPCLVVFPDKKGAERFYREVRFFMGSPKNGHHDAAMRLYRFPPYDMSPLTGLSPHSQLITERINALYALLTAPNPVVVTSFEALTGTLKLVNIPWGFQKRLVRVTVPAGVQAGSKLRLKGLGKITPDGHRGDLFLKVVIG